MKTGILFAGQGAQYPGMGKDLYNTYPKAKEVFEMAGEQIKSWCFEGEEETLKQTHVTQPCVYTVTMAAYQAFWEAVTSAGIKEQIEIIGFAGFSLGEYAALTATGAIDKIEKGLRLVTERGTFMAEAGTGADGQPMGAMAAAMGKREDILALVEETRQQDILEGVNFNSPAQTVVAGNKEAIGRFVEAAKAKKIRATLLPVSTAFHSPMMKPAAEKLRKLLQTAELKAPEGKIYANTTGKDMMEDFQGGDPTQYLAERMAMQAGQPVYWQETIENFKADGVETLVEIGPGKTLSNFAKKIAPDLHRYNVSDVESLEATIAGLKELVK